MENFFQILIYIIIIAVYLFSGTSKKKPAKPSPKEAQKSLQDIMKDLQTNSTSKPIAQVSSTSQPNTPSGKSLQELLDEIKAERRGKNLEERAEDFEEDIFDASFTSDFESGKQVDWDTRIKRDRPKKAEEISDKKMSPKNKPSAYRKLLKDKATLKQAFILSEIFQKKF